MQEEMQEEPKKKRKRKKKKGFGYYLYAVVVLILTLAIIVTATFLLTYVQGIEVTGTEYGEKSAVIEWIEEDPLTINSLYTFWKFKTGAYEMPAYMESVKLGFNAPWEIRVEVKEKEIVGCILSEDAYIYFADDGTVMQKSMDIIEGIPVVEGISAGDVNEYEVLEAADEKEFSYIISITEEIQKNELTPDRLVWEDDSMNLYFGEIYVQLGKINFDEKLVQLPPILEKLEGKKGVLHMEHYNEMSTSISFVESTE